MNATGNGEAQHLSSALVELQRRILSHPDRNKPVEPQRESPLHAFVRSLPVRFRECTFVTFKPPNERAAEVLDQMKELGRAIRQGALMSLILLGPAGTGKDHLLVALGKEAARAGLTVRRVTGPELYLACRDAMETGTERSVLGPWLWCDVLILSDPCLGAVLTAYQQQVLFELVDYRWATGRPIWTAVNVRDSAELERLVGPQIVDRLQDRAIVIKCDWPTFRRPLRVI